MNKYRSNHGDEATPIGELINVLLNKYRLKGKFDESKVVASWERIIGKTVSKHTKRVFLRDKILFVELDSPSLKNDLNFNKQSIIQLFQEEFGVNIVNDLVVM